MANLFSDGFESGNLSAWSASATDGGNLSAAAGAKLHGNYGLSALINDANQLYVEDQTPNNVTRYRCRFYFDPNSLTMANLDEFTLLWSANNAYAKTAFVIIMRYASSAYKIYVNDATDANNYSKYTATYTITDAPHCIEVDWKASSAPGANDGTYSLYIDGVLKETVTGIDSDTESIGVIQLGATSGMDAGTSGTIYFDDFASNNDGTLIGPISTIALTGTITTSITETDIRNGGKTIILTETGDTWVASGATFDAQRQNIINGLDSAQAEAHGWDAEVKAKIAVTDVVRTSDTVVTITLDAEAGYDITAQETITATIPATALTGGVAVVASPTFTVDQVAGGAAVIPNGMMTTNSKFWG